MATEPRLSADFWVRAYLARLALAEYTPLTSFIEAMRQQAPYLSNVPHLTAARAPFSTASTLLAVHVCGLRSSMAPSPRSMPPSRASASMTPISG